MSAQRGSRAKSIPGARVSLAIGVLAVAPFMFAGFPSTESFLPAVGRVPGKNGAQFYTTVWATNLSGVPVQFRFEFLKAGQANPSPAQFSDALAAGETKVYENVVETKLGLANALGAARIVSDGDVLVAERIYNQAPGADLGDTEGLFFAGVPKGFSITAGQSASIQGVNQGGAENFRYNFALVETGGGSADVNVQVFDGSGTLLGQRSFPLAAYEQLQPGVADVVPGVHTTNARITATVVSGTGSVLLAGAQLANFSQDSSGFEMSFRDDLLGGGGAGVTSLNGLTGALTIAHGANTSVNVNGSTITIDAVSGSGTGLTGVAHDNSLAGSGTVAVPLAVANGQVVRSVNGLHDAVTLSAGSNITITPAGNTLTLASSGGGSGGLSSVSHDATLTGDGTPGTPLAIAFPIVKSVGSGLIASFSESGTGSGINVQVAGGNFAIQATSGSGKGIVAGGDTAIEADGSTEGVHSFSNGIGVHGIGSPGVLGEAASGADGVQGTTTAPGKSGVYGTTTSSGYGVYGRAMGTNGAALGASADNGGKAAHFYVGDVYIDNNLHVTKQIFAGTKDFEIDHPLDPENAYLVHASVESSEMLNVYSGNVRLDGRGEAVVTMPSWFEAENGDFRYQLTAIGAPARDLFVAQEIENGEFRIGGGVPGGKVSWQVSAVRRDRWALAHPLVVEEPKAERERGFYLHPELFGAGPERQTNRAGEPDVPNAGDAPGAVPRHP